MEERKLVPIHDQPVQHPSAWYGRDLVNDPSWLVQLAPQDLTEIATAVRGVKMHGLTLGDLRPATDDEVGLIFWASGPLRVECGVMAAARTERPQAWQDKTREGCYRVMWGHPASRRIHRGLPARAVFEFSVTS
jgi:hypothetical protein